MITTTLTTTLGWIGLGLAVAYMAMAVYVFWDLQKEASLFVALVGGLLWLPGWVLLKLYDMGE